MAPEQRRRDDAGRVAGRGVGQADDLPDVGHLGAGLRARRRGGHRAAGRRVRRPPARRAHRPDAGPTRAGRRSRRPDRRGGQGTRHRGQALTDEDDARRRAGPRARRDRPCSPRGRRGRRSPARARSGEQAPTASRRPRVANGATAYTAVALGADGLAQPQEDHRRLVLGLEADEQHGLRLLQVGVRHRAPVGSGGDDVLGEELHLLGRVRPGPEVDVVGVQRDARELAVGVRVLDRHAAADEHAGPAGAHAGRPRRRRGPRATRRRAARRPHRGRAAPRAGRAAWRTGRPTGPCRSSTPR